MYGSSVYNIRREYKDAKTSLLKIIFTILGVLSLLFVFKQLIGIPFDYLNQTMSSFANLGQGSMNKGSWSDVLQRNQFVKSFVVFVTSIIAVCSKFFSEIKQMITD